MERELFVLFVGIVNRLDASKHRPRRATFRDGDIVLIWLWAVLHDRPVDWAVRRSNWPWHDRSRPLPSGSTMSRRLRTASVQALIQAVFFALQTRTPDSRGVLMLDGKPLTISSHARDRDAAFGRAAGGMGKGYKLHAITDLTGNVRVWCVWPMNMPEQAAARELIVGLPHPAGATLLADGAYDVNALYDLAAARGMQLIAKKSRPAAKALGHQYQSPHRLEALRLQLENPKVLDKRRRIEGHFGTMGNVVGGLSPLPNHVRRIVRVTRWVAGKLIIDAAHRLRRASQSAG